jgi:general secretion pathway protein K
MNHPLQHHRTRGAALIAVIFLIAILSLACISTLRVISFDMELASAKVHGSRAKQVAPIHSSTGWINKPARATR